MRRAQSHECIRLAGIAMLGLGLSACAGTPMADAGPVSSSAAAEAPIMVAAPLPAAPYALRPTDVISVQVFREPELSAERVAINADGTLSLPLIGQVAASGMTAQALSEDLTQRFDNAGLKYPRVTVNVVEYASHIVTVEGAVEQPGVYPFRPGARLSSALALAQGPSRVAQMREIAIFRDSVNGMQVAKFDYDAITGGTMADPVIQPGDRVVVGTSALSSFWQDFLRAIPVFGIFATAAR